MHSITSRYTDIISRKELRLEMHKLRSETDWKRYEGCLNALPDNPFITKELLPKEQHQENIYFTLNDDKNILLLLPLILRKIILDEKFTGYYDVTSTYGYSGPLFDKNISKISLHQFWNEIDTWYLRNKVISEFIRFSFNENWKGYTGDLVPTLKNVCGKVLPEKLQWKNFKPKVRNNVRKALKYGLSGKVFHKGN